VNMPPEEPELAPSDKDALLAAADVVRRSGALSFKVGVCDTENEFGWKKGWWAAAFYSGARLIGVDGWPGPTQAAEALARRLIDGARCKCGRVATLEGSSPLFPKKRLTDEAIWSVEEQLKAGQCVWTRQGGDWRSGCAPQAASSAGGKGSRR
jgi:hypothetical protein